MKIAACLTSLALLGFFLLLTAAQNYASPLTDNLEISNRAMVGGALNDVLPFIGVANQSALQELSTSGLTSGYTVARLGYYSNGMAARRPIRLTRLLAA